MISTIMFVLCEPLPLLLIALQQRSIRILREDVAEVEATVAVPQNSDAHFVVERVAKERNTSTLLKRQVGSLRISAIC